MSNPNDKKRQQLISKLKELFQLDQPDLDFGLYRIMHAKSAEITQFLEKDLLPQVQAAFALYKTADKAEIEKELAKVIAGIEAAGMDPSQSPKVKELQAKLQSEAVDVGGLEGEVYDHLLSFFRRYYSEGDFLSRRVYKPGVYAIPYEGEEIKIHSANADQYYIKTSEYLQDYAFRLRPEDDRAPRRVHFRLVEVAEGEHGNVKATEGKDRLFVLAKAGTSGRDFISEVDGKDGKELIVNFEYRPVSLADWPTEIREEKSKPPAQKDLTTFAVKRILTVVDASVAEWIAELGKPHVLASGEGADYSRLEAHLRRYTARNTFDYFIHRDLNAFLRRELDFYIKNEVMHIDDVESESVLRVEQYLSKLRVVRRIAGKVIDFLAQLENFQKKLWLKKKFVVDAGYCVALSSVPETLYQEIAECEQQREEWVALLGIDGIPSDLTKKGYSVPLTPEFLRAHPTLMLDTRNFTTDFKNRLLATIDDLEEQTDCVLIQAENYQALSLLQPSLGERVKCIYIDPPYNTGSDGFAYKDAYQRSSWQAMMTDRVGAGFGLLERGGTMLTSINDIELAGLRFLLDSQAGSDNHVGTLVWKGATDNNPTRIAVEHEYIVCYAKSKIDLDGQWSNSDDETKQLMLDTFERIREKAKSQEEIAAQFEEFATEKRELLGDLYRYRHVDKNGPWTARRNMENPGKPGYMDDVFHPVTGKPCVKPYWGWRFSPTTMKQLLDDERIIFGETEEKIPELKVYLRDVKFPLRSVFSMDARKGSNDLDRLFGSRDVFKNPKPVEVLGHVLPFVAPPGSVVLDFFAGSGTTGHAVINLNREDGGLRKVFLIEMGAHFDRVLVPRIKKIAFSPEWKDGKPKRLASADESKRTPRVIKLVRLESYEDALNNLQARRSETQASLLDGGEAQGEDRLREQYLLRYMLDVETQGSASLLNVRALQDPTTYRLKVRRPGSDETQEADVDLLDTFNWLVGLRVRNIATPQTFSATFARDDELRLKLDGRLKQDKCGPWWFRTVTGALPDGRKALVVWRKLTGKPEEDNLVLDEWFTRQGYSSKDSEFDLIYVNGGNNLENLKTPDDTWKVRLIEEDFHRLMFETEGA